MGWDQLPRVIGYRGGGWGGVGVRDFEKLFGAEGAEKFFEPQAKIWISKSEIVPKTS